MSLPNERRRTRDGLDTCAADDCHIQIIVTLTHSVFRPQCTYSIYAAYWHKWSSVVGMWVTNVTDEKSTTSAAAAAAATTTTSTTNPFNGLFSRTTWVSRHQKGKTFLELNEARE